MKISVVVGDITKLEDIDAVVNAANPALTPGGGVCGAIHKAAGPGLAEECRTNNPMGCHTGSAVITHGYGLPYRFCIHAVGPFYTSGDRGERTLLRAAYQESLHVANNTGCQTIAFPLISTGIYRFPHEDALEIAVTAVKDFCSETDHGLEEVTFVVHPSQADVFVPILQTLIGGRTC